MAKKALGPAGLQVVQAVRAALGEPAPSPIVVGCSGGADSTALAMACGLVLAGRDDWQVRVVDHGLQPGSREVAEAVVERLAARGLPAVRVAVEVVAAGQGPEAAAREARYRALRAPLNGAEPLVAVGHTLDDQAETVLLGLARGSGAASLSGMAPRANDILRPLLGLRRTTTEQACAEWGIETWHDPHNESDEFTRVRVRRHLLPAMDEVLGPGIEEALARTAELLRTDHELLDELATAELTRASVDGRLDCGRLAGLHPALRSRVLRQWLAGHGISSVSLERTRAVEALVCHWRGQGPIELPGGWRVRRRDARLEVTL